jgi:hypothetical protein
MTARGLQDGGDFAEAEHVINAHARAYELHCCCKLA